MIETKIVGGRALLVAILGLAVCGFWSAATVTAENAVTRPLRIQGQSTILLGEWPCELPWTEIEQGVATGIGEFVSVGKYTAYGPDAVAFGVLFAANSDQIYWQFSGGVMTFTGGTGRFEGVTGMLTGTYVSEYGYSSDPQGRVIITYTWKGVGIITY